MLPRGRNRSMRDMEYPEKRARYSTENVLAQTLTDEFYLNHPNVVNFVTRLGIDLTAEPLFDKEAAERRTNLYSAIAQHIWNKEKLIELSS